MKKLLFLLVTVSLLTAACSGGNQAESEPATDAATAPATEMPTETTESAAEGGVAIALLSPEDGSAPMGDAELVLQVVDPATNEPVEVADLQVDLSMSMDGMAPMTTMAIVEPGEGPGQYVVKTNLGMEGTWTMEVKSTDATMPGEATFDLKVK
ncbi:MAG: FixH family protein [Synechococcales bacterium]|nr:FixH family protein [Synechococcales bacterium]